MRKFFMATVLAAALASPALAADPVKLTDTQMDRVSAGLQMGGGIQSAIQSWWYCFLLNGWYGAYQPNEQPM